MHAKDSLGIVSVLHHNGDPRQPWTLTEIDRLPTSHRLRMADIDGGRRVFVNAPAHRRQRGARPSTAGSRRWSSTAPANGSAG